jgi:hypothetical protein
MMKKYALIAGLALSSPAVLAAGGADQMYIGGGLGMNSLSGFDDAMGFQIFGGYNLGNMGTPGLKTAVEVGYMDSGDFESSVCFPIIGCPKTSASGLWATGVAGYAIGQQLDLIGRVGLDFGDDDGLMLGVGLGYGMSKQMQIRGEYVIRDNVDSIQVNVTYNLK